MLQTLRIRNLAVVEDVTLQLESGLNVLTGQTGAGKSLILSAVNILLGQRVSAGVIRTGAERAEVEALFHLAEPPRSDLLAAGERKLIVKREILSGGSGGRSFAYVNGRPCTLKQLAEITQVLIEPHGQNEQLQLRHAENHIVYVDRFAQNTEFLRRYQQALGVYREAAARLSDFDRQVALLKEKRELIEHRLGELARADLQPGEKSDLEDGIRLMANANDVFQALEDAVDRVYDREASALELISQAKRAIDKVKELDSRFEGFVESLQSAEVTLKDIAEDVRDYVASLEFDPGKLEAMQERLAYLVGLERRYQMPCDELARQAGKWKSELEALSFEHEERTRLGAAKAEATKLLLKRGKELTASRLKAAKLLDEQMTREMRDLMMTGARFETQIRCQRDDDSELHVEGTPAKVGFDGFDEVLFFAQTNPGEAQGPLAEIASSGELSRVALALKKIIGGTRSGALLVFDELDAGIGADLGDMIALRLVALAAMDQIICITHMPQIAAAAARHLVVAKETVAGRTTTRVVGVAGEERLREIARMLGGRQGSEKRLALAAEMLQTKARSGSSTVRP